jgi:Coenzyme PQQ synthesis protein D (PqqD)
VPAMLPADVPGHALPEMTAKLRHRRVPTRLVGEKVIVARPHDGAPVVLAATASFVWRQLESWTTADEIDRRMAEAFPDVREDDRVIARAEILGMLANDDLVERG